MLVRCDCCAGKKTIVGLGNIAKKCPACKGVGFKDCDDLANACDSTTSVNSTAPLMDEAEQDKLHNDSLPSKEQKKIDQSLKMKEAWAKRKAKQQG